MRNDDWDYESMFCHVVDRSSGNVVDINIEHFGTDKLLTFITKSASTIRRIRLFSCDEVSDKGLSRMASKLRLLEELDISLCACISHEAVKMVGRSCPLLKSFKFNKEWCRFSDDESNSDEYGSEFDDSDDDYAHAPVARARVRKDDNADALAIAGTMQDLHHLQLYENKLTDDGLRKILDCCPHLESLDLCLCFNLNMGIDLETRLNGLKGCGFPMIPQREKNLPLDQMGTALNGLNSQITLLCRYCHGLEQLISWRVLGRYA